MAGYDIIILPGQSNTVGHGIGPFLQTSPSTNDSKIFQVKRNLTIVPAVPPLDYWGTGSLHSYDMTFARLYAARYLSAGRNILLVPAAQSGTSILSWLGLLGSDTLYSTMTSQITTGLAQAGTNTVVAWVENQGEADIQIALNPADPNYSLMPNAKTYCQRKLDLIDRTRNAFGLFPMIFGLWTDGFFPGDSTQIAFRQALYRAASYRSQCHVTSTDGFFMNSSIFPGAGDTAHYSSQGQEALGLLHFASYDAVVTGGSQ